jgi:hypothetical protein
MHNVDAFRMFEIVGESRASCHHAGLCVRTLGPCVCLMPILQLVDPNLLSAYGRILA